MQTRIPHDRTHRLAARLLAGLAVALFLVAPASANPPWAGPPPDPGTYGSYDVGHIRMDLIDADRADRVLPTEIWYPVDAGTAVGTLTFYELLGPIGLTSDVAIDDATPATGFWFPLIVFSHGSGGFNIQSIALMETLASHGFIVAAPNHTGNTQFDVINGTTDPFPVVTRNRPQDLSYVIDEMLRMSNTPGDPLFLKVNPFLIGATGHSFGGYTALAVVSGFEDIPGDPRVRATLPVSGSANILSDEELQRIHVPALFLGGTLDTVVPIDPVTIRGYDGISTPGAFKYRADVIGATHNHFANICDIGNALIDLGLPPVIWAAIGAGALIVPWNETCTPGAFPIEEAKRIQNLYTVSFFKAYIGLDWRYHYFLTRPYALNMEPNVLFFRGLPACGIGFELVLVLPPLLWLRRRRARRMS